MSVDLRAIVACDLGPIISGDLGANHISDRSGLVITSGRITIDGLVTPARGTDVNLLVGCPQLNRLTRFPKQLRVIRAVTQPLEGRTEVEIGCQLALMRDRKDDRNYFAPADQLLNAQTLLTYCLQQIGITQASGSRQLSREYQVPSVDLSQGYTKIIGDLIRSEGCFGRLKPNNTFEIVPINLSTGQKGPVWTADDFVSLEPISTGSEPPDIYRVMYKSPTQIETTQRTISSYTKEDETISPPQEVYLRYTTQGGQQRSILYVIRARSISKSYYEIREWQDAAGKFQQSDVLVLKRDVKETALGAINSSFLSSCLRYDLRPVDFSTTICNLNESRYQYKPTTDGLITERETTEQKMTPMEFAAGMQVPDYVKLDGSNNPYVYYLPTYATSTPNTLVGQGQNLHVTTRTIVENETVVTQNRTRTRTKTSRWLSRGLTQEGQQEFQWALKGRPDNDVVPGLVEQFRSLKFEGTEIQASEGKPTSFSASITGNVLYTAGQPPNGISTTTTYELPYTPFVGGEDAARAFGEIESGLEVGHAYGFNIVTSFDRIPSLELAPIYIRLAGLEVAFLADSLSYAFDGSGMVVSSDLMLLGVTGYYGSSAPATSWVRMAVSPAGLGAVSSPTVEGNPTKANSVAYPSGFDPLSPGSWFSSIGTGGTDVFAAWKSGAQLIGPSLNRDDAVLTTGPVIEVVEFEYALNTGTDAVTLSSGPVFEFAWVTVVAMPVASITAAGIAPRIATGVAIRMPVTSVAIVAGAPLVAGGASVAMPADSVAIAGLVPGLIGRQKTLVEVPTAGISMNAATPFVASGAAMTVTSISIATAGVAPSVTAKANPIPALSPILWYDFSDQTTVTVVSSEITQITDKGSRGWALSKSTTGPGYAIGINGLYCVDWGNAGHKNYLRNTSSTSTSIGEIYVVLDGNFGSTFGDYYGLITDATGSNYVATALGGSSGFDNFNATPSLNQCFVNNAGTSTYSSGILPAINTPALLRFKKSDNSAYTATTGFQIGQDRTLSNLSRGWGGYIGEVIVFSAPLSSTDRSSVQSWLAAKWGLTLS